MDNRIFAQLDRLESGARIEARPRRDAYNNSSTEYSAYEGFNEGYDDTRRPSYEQYDQYAADEFTDQPMQLDSFGELIPSCNLEQADQI